MNTPVLLEGFAAELVRRGLPLDYAQSTAVELADHHCDLVDELQADGMDAVSAEIAAGERLGERRLLVNKAVGDFQRRHWCGRWPLLTFFIGPIPLMILTCLAMMLAGICAFWSLEKLGLAVELPPDGILSTYEMTVVYVGQALYFFLAPAIVIRFLVCRSKRAGLGPCWPLLSAGVLAVFSGMFLFDFADVAKVNGPADRVLMVMGLPMVEGWAATWRWYLHDPLHICQFLLPMVLATGLVLRNQQLARRSLQVVGDDC